MKLLLPFISHLSKRGSLKNLCVHSSIIKKMKELGIEITKIHKTLKMGSYTSETNGVYFLIYIPTQHFICWKMCIVCFDKETFLLESTYGVILNG